MEIWKYRVLGSIAAVLFLLAVVLPFTQTVSKKLCIDGGIYDLPGQENDLHVVDLARFAVKEHNNKTNALLELENVVKVKQQVVAGVMYYITVHVNEGGAKKLYEAKVWEKLWENSKELTEFKPKGTSQLCKYMQIWCG
uniref:Uncharacterized protein n=1 Tax=Avena sativa TaxID=4498 RepID=A0ACD5VT26_AVESA